MPKLDLHLSPAQARILQALADNNGLRVLWNAETKSGAQWAGSSYSRVKAEIGNPKQASLRKLRAYELIEADGIFWQLSPAGWEALGEVDDDLLRPAPQGVTAEEILAAIRRMCPLPAWMTGAELYVRGFEHRFLDAWSVKIRSSADDPHRYLTTIGFEIKISRQDFQRELQDPRKTEAGMLTCNLFYFATPAGLLDPQDLPEGAGLLEFTNDGRLLATIAAEYRRCDQPTLEFVAALLRNLQTGN